MKIHFKELILVVRPEKTEVTERVLQEHGARWVYRQTVWGRGKEMGLQPKPTWFGTQNKSYPSLRKTLFTAWVEASRVKAVVKEIVEKNKTGRFGDGRIFVSAAEIEGE